MSWLFLYVESYFCELLKVTASYSWVYLGIPKGIWGILCCADFFLLWYFSYLYYMTFSITYLIKHSCNNVEDRIFNLLNDKRHHRVNLFHIKLWVLQIHFDSLATNVCNYGKQFVVFYKVIIYWCNSNLSNLDKLSNW